MHGVTARTLAVADNNDGDDVDVDGVDDGWRKCRRRLLGLSQPSRKDSAKKIPNTVWQGSDKRTKGKRCVIYRFPCSMLTTCGNTLRAPIKNTVSTMWWRQRDCVCAIRVIGSIAAIAVFCRTLLGCYDAIVQYHNTRISYRVFGLSVCVCIIFVRHAWCVTNPLTKLCFIVYQVGYTFLIFQWIATWKRLSIEYGQYDRMLYDSIEQTCWTNTPQPHNVPTHLCTHSVYSTE